MLNFEIGGQRKYTIGRSTKTHGHAEVIHFNDKYVDIYVYH